MVVTVKLKFWNVLSEESQNIIIAPEQENQQLANRISQNQSFK